MIKLLLQNTSTPRAHTMQQKKTAFVEPIHEEINYVAANSLW